MACASVRWSHRPRQHNLVRRRHPHIRRDDQQETNMSLAPQTHLILDNTPHLRPEPELVPSRYALKVGTIDVTVISDGVLSLPSVMLGHNVDPAVRAAWLQDMF